MSNPITMTTKRGGAVGRATGATTRGALLALAAATVTLGCPRAPTGGPTSSTPATSGTSGTPAATTGAGDAPAHPLAAPAHAALAAPRALVSGPSAASAGVGGAKPGFAWWVSDNGRMLLLYRFDKRPNFGHHGEPMGDAPEIVLIDRETGAESIYDEIVATGPLGRHAVLLGGQALWLVDASTGRRQDLTASGADSKPDANACLPPRQAEFDPTGARVGFLRNDPDQAVTMDLATGEEREVDAGSGLLWRAHPDGRAGWWTLREVPRDTDGDGELAFPVQRTSCACRWCGRFAMSYGFYGWGGDGFESFVVGPDGVRAPVADDVIAIGDRVFAKLGGPTLHRIGADPAGASPTVDAPAGCGIAGLVRGASAVILSCSGGSALWWPSDGDRRSLTRAVQPEAVSVAARDRSGHLWIAVVADDGGVRKLSRLRMDDGRLELGPPAVEIVGRHRSGWVTARTADGVALIHPATGRTATMAVKAQEVEGLWVKLADDRWRVLDPAGGRAFETDKEPYLVTGAGCSVEAADGQTRLETGPWTLRCPQ